METHKTHLPGHLKQQNKMHKTYKRSKGSVERLNKGRAAGVKVVSKKTHELRREERRNQMQQMRQKKRSEYLEKRRGLSRGAPFLVALLPLNDKIKVDDVLEFLKSADPEADTVTTPEGYVHVRSPRLKQKFTFATVHGDNLFDKLDLLKTATTLLLLASVEGMDEDGVTVLDSAMAQGLPTVTVAVTDLSTLPPKKWQEGKNKVENDLSKYLPEVDKVLTMDKTGDGMLLLRKIALQKQRSILQRDRRPHLLAESTSFEETEKGLGILKVTGYLRGVGIGLSCNSLVHIPGWGDFQMLKIEMAPVPGDEMTEPQLLQLADPSKQVSLESENIPDPMDAEQTWPTQEELENADREAKEKKKLKKVPHGMSEYMAAWIPDCDAFEIDSEIDEEEKEKKDELMEPIEEEMSSEEDSIADNETVTSEAVPAPEKYDNEMDLDEEKATLEKIQKMKEDEMFPDEVDTPQDIPARKRFARYRGLSSFRTTPWDPKENLPYDYARIFMFDNFDRAKSAALAQNQESLCCFPGFYVTLYIKDVPSPHYHLRGNQPIVVYGLLAHEHKMSVMNVVLKRSLGCDEPIASKDKLMFQVGYRRFRACPIFSQHTNGNKHKFERFFQPETVVVATMFAPIIYPPASVIVFKENKDRTLSLVARGSVLSMNPNRIIVKRVVLSGHPMKVLKRSAVIRFMFFNREDIEWFKPIELKTKFGLRGHIKEPLGTHGHMKCVFNAQLKSNDTALLNLYKRVFPKWSYDPCVNFVPVENP